MFSSSTFSSYFFIFSPLSLSCFSPFSSYVLIFSLLFLSSHLLPSLPILFFSLLFLSSHIFIFYFYLHVNSHFYQLTFFPPPYRFSSIDSGGYYSRPLLPWEQLQLDSRNGQRRRHPVRRYDFCPLSSTLLHVSYPNLISSYLSLSYLIYPNVIKTRLTASHYWDMAWSLNENRVVFNGSCSTFQRFYTITLPCYQYDDISLSSTRHHSSPSFPLWILLIFHIHTPFSISSSC